MSVFNVCVIAYPGAADLDEFRPLEQVPGVQVVRAASRSEAEEAECIVLPGTASPAADLAWLRARGLDSAIALHAQARRPVLGLGGGMQMIGEALIDAGDIAGNAPGLGLLPLVSVVDRDRTVVPARLQFGTVIGHWAPLAGLAVRAAQVRQGRTVQHAGMGAGRVVIADGIGWQNDQGNVLGLAVRGLFEDAGVLQALFRSS
jgi:adenosylcobyric acid synthase